MIRSGFVVASTSLSWILFALLAPVPQLGAAGFSRKAVGTSAGEFLRLGASARGSGMGEAFSSVVDDATALYYNPAALARVPRHSLSLTHAPHLAGTFYDYAGYVRRLSLDHTIGVALQYFGAGPVQRTDELGQDLGAARPADRALTLGYAYWLRTSGGTLDLLNGGSLGASVKFVESTLTRTARTVAFGAGFLSRYYHGRLLRVSFAVDNLGGRLKFDREADPLPVIMRAGAQLRPARLKALVLSVEAHFPNDSPPLLAAGSELSLGPAALRAGFNSAALGSLEGFSAFTAGLGLRQKGWSVDYALVPFGELGESHRLSLSLKF